jgi:hypothetical protein
MIRKGNKRDHREIERHIQQNKLLVFFHQRQKRLDVLLEICVGSLFRFPLPKTDLHKERVSQVLRLKLSGYRARRVPNQRQVMR